MRSRRAVPALLAGLAALAALAVLASSCAYYNTFYLARKYYDIAAIRQPYLVDRTGPVDNPNFAKSIDYAKKVLGQYPKSKWVDDAYVLWARALLGKDDPGQTVVMLQDFEIRYPGSPIKSEAKFYLGVAYRQNRKYKDAARTLDEFLEQAPRHELVPYALVERARALTSLQDYAGAAASASRLLEHWPKSRLVPQARAVRAEANFKRAEYLKAREDFRALGLDARTDEERLTFLLREADCLEAPKSYGEELALLKDAQSHEPPPPTLPEPSIQPVNAGLIQSGQAQGPANDRYGRMMVRIATVYMLQGNVKDAVAAYHGVVRDFPRTPLAAEAQFRIGYAYEIAADDFEQARTEYARVREIANSAFATQAAARLTNLDRIAKFHGATRDTVEAKAEAGFLLAEQYLFQINKPERALEQYRKIEQDFTGTPWAAKAIVAQAWVLSRKLDRKAAADSLFWIAVREHPATEAQLAARDYLEMEGAEVPADLIQLPARQLALADTLPALTPAPEAVAALGSSPPAASDSLGHRAPPTALMPGAALMRPPDPLAVGPPLPGTSAPPLAVGPPAPGTSAPPLAVGPPAPGTNAPPAASGPPAASSSPAASGSPAQATAGPPYASGPPAAHGPQAAPAPPPGAQVPPPARPPAAGSSPAPGSVPPVGPLAPAATTGAQPARDSLRTAPRDTTTAPAGPRKP